MPVLEGRLVVKATDGPRDSYAEAQRRLFERMGSAAADAEGRRIWDEAFGKAEATPLPETVTVMKTRSLGPTTATISPELLAAATKCFQLEMVKVLERNRELESENRTLRAQLTVHRAASKAEDFTIDATGKFLVTPWSFARGVPRSAVSPPVPVGSTRAYAKDGRQFVQLDPDGSILVRLVTGQEFRLSADGLQLDSVNPAKPEDPRSAALARAIAADRLPDGYAR